MDATHSIPGSESLAGPQEVVSFESLDPHTEALRQTDLDSVALRVAMSKVRVAMLREEGGLAAVRSLVDSRAVVMKELLDQLELRMKVVLRAEAEAEKALAGVWDDEKREANVKVGGPSTSLVGSGNGKK